MHPATIRLITTALPAGDSSTTTHLLGYVLLVVGIAVVIILAVALTSSRLRPRLLRASAWMLVGVVSIYLIARAIAEFWVINYSDPASYASSWGGPTLIGVFAVHSGPGLAILIGLAVSAYRLRRRRATTLGLTHKESEGLSEENRTRSQREVF